MTLEGGPAARIQDEMGLVFPHLIPGDDPRECDSVAMAALEHWGQDYQITRELRADTTDCSTIVSQAHWIGAAVQTPFIAENQRRASNGRIIEDAPLFPGDAIYAYASVEDAPDKIHNHVALYLGCDQNGQGWAIEARGGMGVLLTPVDELRRDGGVRRFCPYPERRYLLEAWTHSARSVPKLGRLGARLTARDTGSEFHTGIDIYARPDSQVFAPHDGVVTDIFPTSPMGAFVGLYSERTSCFSVLRPLEPRPEIKVGGYVASGSLVGSLALGASGRGCNAIPSRSRDPFLHWELWSTAAVGGPSPAPHLVAPSFLSRLNPHGHFEAFNPLYAVKIGKVQSVLTDQTINDHSSQRS